MTASLNEELASIAIADLDLVFVMDTTGSMRREIADIQANLLGIVRILHRLAPSLNVGFVAFRDRGEEYVTRAFPLSPMTGNNLPRIPAFVEELRARGGDDHPESVGVALEEAVAMNWRDDAQGRIIVIGDAPDRPNVVPRIFSMARQFQDSAPSDTPAAPRFGDLHPEQSAGRAPVLSGSGRRGRRRLRRPQGADDGERIAVGARSGRLVSGRG